MNKLKKQIKQLETEIIVTDFYIQQQFILLQKKVYTTRVVAVAMLASFTYGFALTRGKTLLQTLARLAATALSLKRVYNSFKTLERFIFYV